MASIHWRMQDLHWKESSERLDIHGFVSDGDEQDFNHAHQASGFSEFHPRLSRQGSQPLNFSARKGAAIMANQAGAPDSRPAFFFDIDNCVCLKSSLPASSRVLGFRCSFRLTGASSSSSIPGVSGVSRVYQMQLPPANHKADCKLTKSMISCKRL
jgi:hypothetical protein